MTGQAKLVCKGDEARLIRSVSRQRCGENTPVAVAQARKGADQKVGAFQFAHRADKEKIAGVRRGRDRQKLVFGKPVIDDGIKPVGPAHFSS